MKKLISAAAAVLCLLAAPVQAAVYNLTLEIVGISDLSGNGIPSSPLLGTSGPLSFEFSDSLIPTTDRVFIRETDLTSFSLTLLGQTFDKSDLNRFAVGVFSDGTIGSLQFNISEDLSAFGLNVGNPTDIDFPNVLRIRVRDALADGVVDGRLSVTAVPLPAGLPLLLGGLGVVALLRRRRTV